MGWDRMGQIIRSAGCRCYGAKRTQKKHLHIYLGILRLK